MIWEFRVRGPRLCPSISDDGRQPWQDEAGSKPSWCSPRTSGRPLSDGRVGPRAHSVWPSARGSCWRARRDTFGAELAQLAPILRKRRATLPPPQSTDPETERYLLYRAVVGLVEAGDRIHVADVGDRRPSVGGQTQPPAVTPSGGEHNPPTPAHRGYVPERRAFRCPPTDRGSGSPPA